MTASEDSAYSEDFAHRDAAAVVERYLASNLSDGLPMMPPTRAAIAAMVDAMGKPPGTVIGAMPPGNAEATVDHVAANAVLAGCLPDYGPVVLAAVEAMLDDGFALYGIACSTKGAAPLAIVNGPIRHRLGMKAKGNLFGHGNRANATIGRALRLVIQNIAQAVPDVLDRATLGHPGKYSYCVAEDEEDSPWEPLHVERGIAAEDSAVTLVGCEAPRQIGVQRDSGEAILTAIAHALAAVGVRGELGSGRSAPALAVFAAEHRTVLARESWSRAAIKEFIADNAVIPAPVVERITGAATGPVRVLTSPEDLLLVAGGGIAGPFSAVCPGWSWQSRPVTVAVPPPPART